MDEPKPQSHWYFVLWNAANYTGAYVCDKRRILKKGVLPQCEMKSACQNHRGKDLWRLLLFCMDSIAVDLAELFLIYRYRQPNTLKDDANSNNRCNSVVRNS